MRPNSKSEMLVAAGICFLIVVLGIVMSAE